MLVISRSAAVLAEKFFLQTPAASRADASEPAGRAVGCRNTPASGTL